MEPKAIHLGPGADLRKSLEQLAQEEQAEGYVLSLSLIHISEPTRRRGISYAVFCLKK